MRQRMVHEPIPADAGDTGFIDVAGRRYEITQASDIVHDGMWLELRDVTDGKDEEVMTAFRSDHDDAFEFHASRNPVSFLLAEYFLLVARKALTANRDSDEPPN